MKQITALFVAFLGIYPCFSQPVVGNDSLLAKPVKEKATAKIFPNPTRNKAEITLSGFEAGYVRIHIISAAGTVFRDDNRLLLFGEETVVLMFSLPPGIYFVLIRQKEKMVRKRLVVQ